MEERERFAIVDIVGDANRQSIEARCADERGGILVLFAEAFELGGSAGES
jgi:hypothetical protein